MTERQLVDRLNELGYAQRDRLEKPGEFAIGSGAVAIMPRGAGAQGPGGPRRLPAAAGPDAETAARAKKPPPPRAADRVQRLELGDQAERAADARRAGADRARRRRAREAAAGGARGDPRAHAAGGARDRGSPLLRASRRRSDRHGRRGALEHPRQARLHRRRQHDHAAARAQRLPAEDVSGHDAAGGARRSRSRRKLLEIWVSFIITTRASKDEILEMYLNDMPLGQRGSFAIVGVPEASRLFFGKDVSNVTLAEAATIAGVFQSPSALSPFNNPARCKERRNVVLQAMVDAGYVTQEVADRADPRAARRRPARARSRGAVLRRLRRPDARRAVSGPHDDDDAGGRRLHDARSAPAAARAGRGARRPDAGRQPAGASGSAARRRRR